MKFSKIIIYLLIMTTWGCNGFSSPTVIPLPSPTATLTPTMTLTPLPPTATPTPLVKSTWRCDPSGGLACFRQLSYVKIMSATEVWATSGNSPNSVVLHYTSQNDAITPTWQFISPKIITPFHSLTMFSLNEGWAIGYYYLMYYKDKQWYGTHVLVGNALAIVNSNDIWNVGNEGRITHYFNNHWQEVIKPARGQEHLMSVVMLSATDGWATGQNKTLLHYNGQQWQAIPPEGRPYFVYLIAMEAVNDHEIWAAGDGIYHFKNGTWQQELSSVITDVLFQDLSMVSADEGWFVGSKELFHYQQGTWQQVTNPTGKNLYSIDMLNQDEGWAVGENGVVLHYHDGAWEVVSQSRLPDLSINDLAWVDETQEGWAVGYGGQIYHYQQGEWTKLAIPTEVTNLPNLEALDLISPTEGWAVGVDKNQQGTLYHFTQGQWNFKPILVMTALRDVDMLTEKVGLAVGVQGTIQQYRFNNWELRTAPTTNNLSAVNMVSETEAWAVGQKGTILHYLNDSWVDASLPEITNDLTAIQMVSSTAGWIIGNQTLLHYHQGQWQAVALPNKETYPSMLSMLSDQEGWFMTDQGVWHYKNGLWDLEETPIQLHGALHMVNEHEGWAVGYGILHYTNQP